MEIMTEKAYAKLNISLDVLGVMPDGYHEMEMVMQSVALCDDVTVRLEQGEGIRVRTNLKYLPNDHNNIAARAAAAFMAEAGLKGTSCTISLVKRIPVCAGLGGGSSDAAAVLRAMNILTGTGMSGEELEKLGGRLGSDVPFCVRGGTQLAKGKGEILTRLPEFPQCWAVICKPRFPISTPELFKRIDSRSGNFRPDTSGIIKAIEAGDLAAVSSGMYNVFEDVLFPKYGAIHSIKRKLRELGATNAMMSGTGSAVFGLFAEEGGARHAQQVLLRRYRDCFVTRPVKYINIYREN